MRLRRRCSVWTGRRPVAAPPSFWRGIVVRRVLSGHVGFGLFGWFGGLGLLLGRMFDASCHRQGNGSQAQGSVRIRGGLAVRVKRIWGARVATGHSEPWSFWVWRYRSGLVAAGEVRSVSFPYLWFFCVLRVAVVGEVVAAGVEGSRGVSGLTSQGGVLAEGGVLRVV